MTGFLSFSSSFFARCLLQPIIIPISTMDFRQLCYRNNEAGKASCTLQQRKWLSHIVNRYYWQVTQRWLAQIPKTARDFIINIIYAIQNQLRLNIWWFIWWWLTTKKVIFGPITTKIETRLFPRWMSFRINSLFFK